MITSWQIYWILKLDSIRQFTSEPHGTAIMMSLCILTLLISGICSKVFDNEDRKITERIFKFIKLPALAFTLLYFIMTAIYSFTPSTKEMAAIIVVPKVCNAVVADSALRKIPSQITSLASDWLTELKPKSVKEGVKEVTKVVDNAKK